VTGLILAVVGLVFILQNETRVQVSLFMLHWRIPLALDLLFAAVLGGAMVLAATSLRALRHRRQARRQPDLPGGTP
jgi:uncharacterized integral membrane protein